MQATKLFHEWAQLPVSHEEFRAKQAALERVHFPSTKPLPGVEALLSNLSRTANSDAPVHIALATSSMGTKFHLKTAHLSDLFSVFPSSRIIVGDDPRIGAGRGKPLPDIYLLALETINQELREQGNGEREITPEECLVFEDSVPGIEAGRRAGMRVIWCPHEGLLQEYRGREEEVLAGLTGEHKDIDQLDTLKDGMMDVTPWRRHGSGKPGELGDGWGELLATLESFPYESYGIRI